MRLFFFILVSLFLLMPLPAFSRVLTEDTIWSGTVELHEDVYVPAGVSLTVQPGTVVLVWPSGSAEVDPEYMSPMTELLVRGKLSVKGTREEQVRFQLGGQQSEGWWAGIVVDQGEVSLENCTISDAEEALFILNGSLRGDQLQLRHNRYGLVAHGAADIVLRNSRVLWNEYGVLLFRGARLRRHNVDISENSRKDIFAIQGVDSLLSGSEVTVPDVMVTASYGNETLVGTTVWKGRVRINGLVRVPPEARLVILPGTVVEFSFYDSNGDGIGENGLFVQGGLIAKGSRQQRIVFTSSRQRPAVGDWGEINLEQAQESFFVNCDFQYGGWVFHSHFTVLTIKGCRFLNNDGGIRFRSGPVSIRDSLFRENRIGIRSFRGKGQIAGNRFVENEIAVFVRERGGGLTIQGNGFEQNDRYAIRLGDFNQEDVDARNNWWGGDSPSELIFDSHQEDYIGTVLYEPILKAPVILEFD